MKFLKWLYKNKSLILVYFIIFLILRRLIGVSPACLLFIICFLYGSSMTLSYYGMAKLSRHEKEGTVCVRSLTFLSMAIASPIYLVWLIFSFVPVISYEVWLITGLPLVVVGGIPLGSIAEHWTKKRKQMFWAIQVLVYLICFVIGQTFVAQWIEW